MHELAITRNIVAIVGDAAQGRRVTRVTLEIGKLSGVMADAVAFCFDVVAAETPLAGARLDIRQIDKLIQKSVVSSRVVSVVSHTQ